MFKRMWKWIKLQMNKFKHNTKKACLKIAHAIACWFDNPTRGIITIVALCFGTMGLLTMYPTVTFMLILGIYAFVTIFQGVMISYEIGKEVVSASQNLAYEMKVKLSNMENEVIAEYS